MLTSTSFDQQLTVRLARRRSVPSSSARHGSPPTSCRPTWRTAGADPARLRHDRVPAVHLGLDGAPKGVMVTHGNLLHNLTPRSTSETRTSRRVGVVAAGDARHGSDRRRAAAGVQRMPRVSHVAGGISAATGALAAGHLDVPRRRAAAARTSPTTSRHRVSAADREGLDLRCWEAAYNGAEPITPGHAARVRAAVRATAASAAGAFRPCYGLAESTLLVTSGRWRLTQRRRWPRSRAGTPRNRRLACGSSMPIHGQRLRGR